MEKKNIAIVQSDSPESILCLAPTLSALKYKNPQASITLITHNSLFEAASLLIDIDFIESSLAEPQDFDEIIYLGENTKYISHGSSDRLAWKSLLEALPHSPSANPYHKADLLKKIAGIDTIESNYELKVKGHFNNKTLKEMAENGIAALKVAISINQLEQNEIVSIIESQTTLNFPVEFFLIGTVKNRKLSTEIKKICGDSSIIHDFCGEISVSDTAELLRFCDVNFSAPGFEGLLSSGFGTFTICIDSSQNRNPFYYPYGHGHLILQPQSDGVFTDNLTAQIAAILQNAVSGNGGNIPNLDQWQAYFDANLGLFLSKIRILSTQRVEIAVSDESATTELYFKPLVFLGSESLDVIKAFYRILWEYSLEQRVINSTELQILHQDTISILCETLKPLEQLYELANFGRTYSSYVRDSLLKQDIAKSQQDAQRLQEIEDLIYSLGYNYQALQPICAMHARHQVNLPECPPLEMAEKVSTLFWELQNRVLVLLDLKKTLFHTNLQGESSLLDFTGEEDIYHG